MTRLARFATPAVRWIALLGLCAAYLQGGLGKLTDLNGAAAEMGHFGLNPAWPYALAVIALEILASVAILTGYGRWLGALALSGFTLGASFLANRYWQLGPPERFAAENSFYEQLGLGGGFYWWLGMTYVTRHDAHDTDDVLAIRSQRQNYLLSNQGGPYLSRRALQSSRGL
jgi:uncharacterized membrane protein YphA (DoxX/SURF4 family)